MTTTVSVLQKGRMQLPDDFRRRKRIKPGMTLRVTEVGDGLYVTPLPEPSEHELRKVISAAGSLNRHQTAEEEDMVQRTIAEYRREKRAKRG